jgi:ribonuclease HII
MDRQGKYIVGIDEVGRGPIAGPVAVCAFACTITNYELLITNAKEKLKIKLRDSKKLSKKQREVWFEFLRVAKTEGFCDYSVAFVSPENIDKFGIAKCIQKALNESLMKVVSQNYSNFRRFTQSTGAYTDENLNNSAPQNMDKNLENSVSPSSYQIYLDGGLHAPVEYTNQETIIRGDELHPIISMASIMAKVTRDRIMTNYVKDYPEYGFDHHVGYGTKAHYDAIKKHGQTSIHRKSFIHT